MFCFFFSSRRRHTRLTCDWSSDVCSADLAGGRRRDRSNRPEGGDARRSPGPGPGSGGVHPARPARDDRRLWFRALQRLHVHRPLNRVRQDPGARSRHRAGGPGAAGGMTLVAPARFRRTQKGDVDMSQREVATVAGGCFWCLEAAFQDLKGVERVQSGYSDGRVPNPSYEDVCTGSTGHAEVVQITFDPTVVSFNDLLHVFFTIHDPTTLNRQGGDVGTQYRSAVFYHTPEQKAVTEQVIKELAAEHVWDDPIVTEVKPLEASYPAEEYHRDYYRRNPNQGYGSAVIAPKVAKVRKLYFDKLKQPVG